ncbi:MAG: histidine phosphatase family protein [Alphaproteobacteria bacterium]|nr:histidine phosphatase family protein [Alphaproteobacteria bacterium]
MKRLIIARHGNTFAPGETPTRVGAKTDLPLVEETRGRGIGKYLKQKNLIPTKIVAAPLKRTMKTAELAAEELGYSKKIEICADFTEIDYGPDENKTEDVVIARIGQQAIDLWNEKAIVPEGWKVDPNQIIETWKKFAEQIADNETVLLVSSNGVIRFAPYIVGDYDEFCKTHDIKVATGAVCVLEFESGKWTCSEWNTKAFKFVD